MKSFTSTSILKSTTVEIISPKLVKSPEIQRLSYKQPVIQGTALELPVLNHSYPKGLAADTAGIAASLDHEEVSALLRQAKAEADRIVNDAKKKAEMMLKEAEEERASLRKEFEDSVRKEVIPLAKAEGYNQGLAEAQKETQRLRNQAKNYLELARCALKDEYARVDKELVALCLKICECITHSTLTLQPTNLLNIIRNLALMPHEKQNMKIHISGEDWEWFRELPAEDLPPYQIIVDESLRAGDTFLECEEGIFDARINSQLEKIEQYLLEELGNGGLDGSSQET